MKTLEERNAAKPKRPKTRAKKGTGSVYRESVPDRPDIWRGENTVDGARHRTSGKTEAIAWARLEALKNGENPKEAVLNEETLVGYISGWIKRGIGARGRPVKPTYSIRLEINLRRHIAPYFKETRLIDVTPKMVADFIANRREVGYPNGTLTTMRNTLSGALGQARNDGLIASNPGLGHSIGKANSGFIVPGASVDMARQVLAAVRFHRHRDFFSLLMYEPARTGELLRLDWRHIHHQARQLTVFETETREFGAEGSGHRSRRASGPPKSLAGRRAIPIPEEALRLLKRRHDEAGQPRSGLVFPSITDPEVPLNGRSLLDEFKELMLDAGIPLTKLHDLRHLGITILIEAGVPIPVVSKIAGHSNPAITASHYAHVLAGSDRLAIEQLAFGVEEAFGFGDITEDGIRLVGKGRPRLRPASTPT